MVPRTEIEIFPHDELGAWGTHAQFGQVGRGDAEGVHVRRQVTASLPRTPHIVYPQLSHCTTRRLIHQLTMD